MSGLLVLIPIAIGLGLLALVTFLWALKSGQYEDLEGASQRILDDDQPLSGPPVSGRRVPVETHEK